MNQLPNIVIDFARYRRADGAARRLTAPDIGGQRAGAMPKEAALRARPSVRPSCK